jgi:hypothetical protein
MSGSGFESAQGRQTGRDLRDLGGLDLGLGLDFALGLGAVRGDGDDFSLVAGLVVGVGLRFVRMLVRRAGSRGLAVVLTPVLVKGQGETEVVGLPLTVVMGITTVLVER